MAKTSKTNEAVNLKVNEKKWSKELMATGWTVIPNIIIERQQALGLDAVDINILLHLAMYWWSADSKPHPSKSTLAKAIGLDPRTIQRHIARLEAGGLIKRIERRIPSVGSKTNIYDLSGLIKEAKPYALERAQELVEKEAIKKMKAGKKGKPKLKPVETEEN
ncbi:MAG: helix-turn-helix domain-containing protein [Robiginitomaculum sp.]|nr:MAG: helix-turn-helix domain-containing protein [Robiginitomaculum sp.]